MKSRPNPHLRARRHWRAGLAIALCAVAACLPGLVEAQYFGRNKVQWQQFHFEVLETPHFRIYYYPANSPIAGYVARISERWYTRLSRFFDHDFTQPKPIIIYQDHAEFQQTEVTSGLISEGIGGFTEPLQNRVVLPLTGINADNNHVIGHELVHVFQFDLMHSAPKKGEKPPQQQQQRTQQLPQWMIEGLAEYLSQGRHDPATAMWMRDAVAHDRLPDPDKLIQRQLSPYQYGQAVWAYIAGQWSDDAARRLFLRALRIGPDKAMQDVLDMKQKAFFEQFHATLRSAYQPLLDGRQAPDVGADPLITEQKTKASVNIAPSLSPDGKWIAYLSTQQLSVELYLANAETGKVVRKLVAGETDPHFSNLSFLDSSVAWSPDSRRFAFSVFAEGERRLALYDMDREKVVKRIDLAGIKGMRQAAWSPDGRSLVFSAIVNGASDLYRVDVDTERLTRLTNDAYTAVQPAFSPDGKHIVFVTDRGQGTDLDRLQFGDLRLALLDVATDDIRVLPIFSHGKQTDPHYAPDGKSIYFIGEPDGVPDVFNYRLSDGETRRLTSVKTGVSGFTDTSPALSVGARTGSIVYSVLQDGGWNIYRQKAPQGTRVAAVEPTSAAGGLPPPLEGKQSVVENYLSRPELGLLSAGRFYPKYPYKPHLQLVDVGPATIGVGQGVFGAEAGGAMSAYFADKLNRHQIAASIQGLSTQGVLSIKDTLGADVTYLNQAHRFKWGARASRQPYLGSATFLSRGNVDIDGNTVPADLVQRLYQVVTVNDISAIGEYPFSMNDRVEVALGASNIDFKAKLESVLFPQGYAPQRDTSDLPSPPSLNLRNASVAYVRDTSQFGFISPVRGTRFRAENEWTTGDLDFQTATLDFRHYFFRKPLTFAVRVLQVGRYGPDSDDPRLPPFDIGNSALVRGYEFGSFNLSECTRAAGLQGCPEIDRLVGSRIAVMNFELRAQLLGSKDFGVFNVAAAPTEAVFFIDAGAAWSRNEPVDWTFDRNTLARVPVVSAGIAFRSLIFGRLPIEFYYAYPYQRPGKGAVTGFRIGAGW